MTIDVVTIPATEHCSISHKQQVPMWPIITDMKTLVHKKIGKQARKKGSWTLSVDCISNIWSNMNYHQTSSDELKISHELASHGKQQRRSSILYVLLTHINFSQKPQNRSLKKRRVKQARSTYPILPAHFKITITATKIQYKV